MFAVLTMKTLITILLLLVSSVAHGGNTIVGAFGQTLDTVFDPLDPTLDKTVEEGWGGKNCFRFLPRNPEPTFDNYVLCVSPVKRKIYRIRFWGGFYDKGQCSWEMHVIDSLLGKKYPELLREIVSANLHWDEPGDSWTQFTQEDERRAIDVRCMPVMGEKNERGLYPFTGKYSLSVEYSLWPWEQMLYQEKLDERMSEIDDTNF